jgi:hypothetical protein
VLKRQAKSVAKCKLAEKYDSDTDSDDETNFCVPTTHKESVIPEEVKGRCGLIYLLRMYTRYEDRWVYKLGHTSVTLLERLTALASEYDHCWQVEVLAVRECADQSVERNAHKVLRKLIGSSDVWCGAKLKKETYAITHRSYYILRHFVLSAYDKKETVKKDRTIHEAVAEKSHQEWPAFTYVSKKYAISPWDEEFRPQDDETPQAES